MLRRSTPVFILLLVIAATAPALADDFIGRAECGSSGGPGCDVSAESGGGGGSGSGGGTNDETGSGGGSAGSETAAEPACGLEGLIAWCSATVGGGPVGGDDVPAVDYEALAHEARASLSLGSPGISMSPGADAPILVHVPVWLWVDGWEPQSATASVPGGSVTVTATPSALSWAMGDGTTVECEGPGTAYNTRVHDPEGESPDCGHTYSSRGVREVDASTAWSITWSSTAGEGGSLPDLVTTSSASVRVVESSGVVT